MTHRDKLAGIQHLAEFTLGCIGLFGWLYWVTHKPTEYHSCQCLTKRDREIMQKVGL